MTELLPGDIGFSKISGLTGLFVRFGQFVIGDDSPFTHVYIVVANNTDGTHIALEAMPSGMRYRLLDGKEEGVAYARINLTAYQRLYVPELATQFKNIRYGFSAYLYLFLNQFGWAPGWLKRYIERNERMICSQTADELLRRIGYHVFNDGRMPHDVTPG